MSELESILNYLETTSMEPHDDYTSEFSYKEQKVLWGYIKQLEWENQKLKKQLEVGKEQYNDVVEEKEKYKETVDKAIHLLEQFDAWLEPQDFLKIKKIEKVLEEVNK